MESNASTALAAMPQLCFVYERLSSKLRVRLQRITYWKVFPTLAASSLSLADESSGALSTDTYSKEFLFLRLPGEFRNKIYKRWLNQHRIVPRRLYPKISGQCSDSVTRDFNPDASIPTTSIFFTSIRSSTPSYWKYYIGESC